MTSKERMRLAMNLQQPDRVPVMCQLSLGHYFLHSGVDPMAIWYTSEGFAEALIRLCNRYRFDGILVNLPGREPDFAKHIQSIGEMHGEKKINWKNGNYTIFPNDDNPHYYQQDGSRFFPEFDAVDPDELFYIDPWDITDITYPFTWGFDEKPRPFDDFFPEYHLDTIKQVTKQVGDSLSIHSEIFSPWSQFLELLNYENALMAIIMSPEKAKACLERLTAGAIDLARRQVECSVDAILLSSAFAGAGLISRDHYREFVFPYEKRIAETITTELKIPVYTHTCGSIGDRLDLMLATKTCGVDTLDPPPLGTVELADAKQLLSGKAFIKGNLDPVNTMLYGNLETVREAVAERIRIGKTGGGYILSTACSVAPNTPPGNIELLTPLAEELGKY
ncbi:MAG: hypothetical protein KDE52_01940 [Calditrichaeota bacterium]|nr:hypothetical protein [Calditrichota bacterium]